MLTELPFIPGVIKDEEAYTARGAATDSQLIRWVRGKPEVLGGWAKVLEGIQGAVRAMHEWTLTDGRAYMAIGTSSHLYVFDGERLIDITPERLSAFLDSPDPFSTTLGSSLVTVSHALHGAVIEDVVYIGGATAVAGLQVGGQKFILTNPLSTIAGSRLVKIFHAAHNLATNDIVDFQVVAAIGGLPADTFVDKIFRVIRLSADEFQIETPIPATATATGGGSVSYRQYTAYKIHSTLSVNAYRIDAGAPANATTTGGGLAIVGTYDINTGSVSSGFAGGYGAGGFGLGLYGGSTLIDTTPFPLRQWSLDNFGSLLVACLSMGTTIGSSHHSIFLWPYADRTDRAQPITTAPNQVVCIVTTPERFLLACGCTNEDFVFDPMLVRHSTGEDPTVWVAATDNSAGDFPVSGGSRIVGVERRETGPMIFTDRGLNAVRTIGAADQIYKAEQIGVDCGLLAMHAATQRDGDLYWLSPAYQFYVYRGGRPVALECPLREWLEQRVNKVQADKIFAWPDRRFEAVSFHYPSGANNDIEPSDYVRLDVPEARRDPRAGWSVGVMDRTACSAGYVFPARKPLAVNSAGALYQHEDGFTNDGAPHTSFVQWAPIDLQDGQTRAGVNRVQADLTLSEPMTILLGFREWPNGPAGRRALVVTPTTEKNDLQARGRQVDMRLGLVGSSYWRAGAIRFNLIEGNRR